MATDYRELLIELKPMLPRGYQRKIADSLTSVALWQVKNAFTGRDCSRPALKKIYNKARRMAAKEKADLLRARSELKALQKMSVKKA